MAISPIGTISDRNPFLHDTEQKFLFDFISIVLSRQQSLQIRPHSRAVTKYETRGT
jgi:hypothetical protein